MQRQDWLLLLLGFKGATGSPELDPVRIQKGMFLLSQEGGLEPGEAYPFEPLHYGPYSREVRRDVEELVRLGLVEERAVPGYTWAKYRLTQKGIERAGELLTSTPPTPTRRLFDIKNEVTGLSFQELLRRVYKKYPNFAVNSIFNG